jgi:hypothetical protein
MPTPNIVNAVTLGTGSVGGVNVSFGGWTAQFEQNIPHHTPAVGNLVILVGGRDFNQTTGGTMGSGWNLISLNGLTPGSPTQGCSSYRYIWLMWKIWTNSDTVGETAMFPSTGANQYTIYDIAAGSFDPINPIPQTLILGNSHPPFDDGRTNTPPFGPSFTTCAITPNSIGMLPIFVAQGTNSFSPAGPPTWMGAGATLDGYSFVANIGASTPLYLSTAHGAITTDITTPIVATFTADANNPQNSNWDTIVLLVASGPPPTPVTIPSNNVQTPTFTTQVYRNGNWIDIRTRSASARIDKGKAGQMTLVLDDNANDPQRSHLYEGEKVRAYRGVVGSTSTRSWTGFVDAPTITDEGPISRSVVVTDYLQELNTAILLDGHVFDNYDPMYVCASVIQNTIDTGQYVPTDDANNSLTGATTNFSTSSGNKICYFPELFNLNGSAFTLASGQLGSYTSGPFAYASMSVPIASGNQAYLTYTLPNQYLIASMTQILGSTMTLATSSVIPPASGQYVADYYNGVLYFNTANQGQTLYLSSTFFQSPIWSFAPGTKAFDIISEVMDKSGCRWGVDAYGKFWSKFIDSTTAPKRIFNRASYINLSLQINRDRRNVIVVEGWNPILSQLIVSMAVNYTDIFTPPPSGLGKKQIMIVQDQSWITQSVVNQAAYYAAQQIGRRGKIKTVKIIDDPTINVEDCVAFVPAFPELTPGDFFYVDSIEWTYAIPQGGGITSTATLSGGSLPGQGIVYINTINTNAYLQALGITNIQPIRACSLTPAGGNYYSSFSIAGGLTINFDESYRSYGGLFGAFLNLEVYGSDSSYQKFSLSSSYQAGGTYSYPISMTNFNPFVFYVFKLSYQDPFGNLGIYRDFISALP